MSTHITDEARYHSWEATPEPLKNERDPQIIADDHLEGTVWLYSATDAENEWLVYEGEAKLARP